MVTELLATLRELDVKVWAEGEQIRVSTPKGTLQPELRQKIKDHKTELLAVLRAAQTTGGGAKALIPPAARTAPLSLSSAQQRMWFLDQLEPGSSAYNLFASRRFLALRNPALLERCFTELVRRHEILRARFVIEHGQPCQIILPPAPWHLPVLDLQNLAPAARKRQIAQAVAEQTACPFDLAHGPLLRTLLIQSAPDDFLLLVVMHHIIGDATSIKIMWRELDALYAAFSRGLPSPLPDLPIQYGDYAVWQQAMQDGPELERQLLYWKNRLAGNLPLLELPTDARRSLADSKAGWQSALLPQELAAQLLVLAQRQHTTLFMVMLAAFELLLHRLSGQDDIVMGTPISGRNHPDVEGLVGLFLNTVVLRADLSGNPTFAELLRRVQAMTLGAYSNQDLPFERLVEEIQPDRNLNRNPIFDVLINFFSQPDESVDPHALGWGLRNAAVQDAKLPLTFYIEQYREDIGLRVLYQQSLFSGERMRALLDELVVLLHQVAANPGLPIAAYSLVTVEPQLLLSYLVEPIVQPTYAPAMQSLLRWAQDAPDLPALVQGDLCWSYAQLGECATRLARTLVALGLQRGDVVAVTGPRNPSLYAALAAALLSGGVLLTLDPALPARRQQVMLAEAKARWLLLCDTALPESPPWNDMALNVVWVEPTRGAVRQPTAVDLTAAQLPVVEPDDPAYIFFTSGTTNTPKGVLGVHKGLSHFLEWQRTTFAISPGDRAAQLTGLSFDVVLRDVFLPLTSGAALYLPGESYLVGSRRAIEWMEANEISVLHTVPGIVQAWLADLPPGIKLKRMRWVFFAGEPLGEALVLAWRGVCSPATQIINLYGPTETTLAKFYYQTPDDLLAGVQPVGTALPNTQALVLRPDNQLCGVGEPGEIVIRTPFHSLGYINAPEEQRKRFVPNPFNQRHDDLVYYTGDRGRYRPDSSLDILGRLDDQVKINGVRIEPGELTAALLAHPLVKAGAVIARKNNDQQYELVAYVVADAAGTAPAGAGSDGQPLGVALRRYYADRFPAAMTPRSFVLLEKLPLNHNGKVDRRALPAPAAAEDDHTEHRRVEAPHDVTEARLVEIWRKLLKVERVGINDDFFALGGYSMLAVRMFAQIYEAFGVHLPLTCLFQQATIQHLAALIHEQIGATPWSSLVELRAAGSKPPFFCVHGMTGDVFWFGDLVAHLDPEQPFWGLQSRGLDGIQEPLTSIEAMAAHYVAEMRTLQPQGPYYIGGYSFGGSVAYAMTCLLRQQGQEVALLAIIDHATPASGYYHHQLSPNFFYNFFRNLPYRVQDFLRRRPDQIWARIRRQLFIMNSAAGRSRRRVTGASAVQASELIDQAPELPAHVQRVIEANFNAIQVYQPQPYAGKLTLLAARGGRLFVNHDRQMGWGRFVTGDVDVRIIPGSHLRLFHPAHVGQLAGQLQACLNEAQLRSQVE
jgi:amino acid adenylation domain-containing protein